MRLARLSGRPMVGKQNWTPEWSRPSESGQIIRIYDRISWHDHTRVPFRLTSYVLISVVDIGVVPPSRIRFTNTVHTISLFPLMNNAACFFLFSLSAHDSRPSNLFYSILYYLLERLRSFRLVATGLGPVSFSPCSFHSVENRIIRIAFIDISRPALSCQVNARANAQLVSIHVFVDAHERSGMCRCIEVLEGISDRVCRDPPRYGVGRRERTGFSRVYARRVVLASGSVSHTCEEEEPAAPACY